MGRMLCLKKIENITKCQVTYSKRRSGIMKKCREISVCCDAEVAFVAFSPSGRITKFSFPKRIEDMIDRYVNLPADLRYNDIENVQDKLEKQRYLHHMEGERCKLLYLDQRIENLNLQITKKTLELQIMEADISAYEPLQDKYLTLNQLIWNEKNVKHSLEKVIERKDTISASFPFPQVPNNIKVQMPYEGVLPFLDNFSGSCSNYHGANSSLGKLPVQLDPWIVPPSAEACEGLVGSLIDQEKRKSVHNQGIAISTNYRTCDVSEKVQPQHLLMPKETQFLPPAENAIGLVAQCDSEIPSWNVINNILSQTLHDVQPPDLQRNGQIALEKTEAPNDQILTAADQQTIGIYELNDNNINNPTSFFNMNNNNGDIIGSGCQTEVYIPVVEEINSPLALFSDTLSFEELFEDGTSWASHSQAEEIELLDCNWDSLPRDYFKHLLD